MSTVKLSQWEMMLLETARANGFVDEEIIHKLRTDNRQAFADVEGGRYDFSDLFELAQQDPFTLETAIREGYQIKFTTINGVKFLLNKRFGLTAETDYQVQETALDQIRLTDDALAAVHSTLSPNWRIIELEKQPVQKETIVRIELAQ
ncbi:hypothetical protein EDM59_16340 [Brevibacillus nitrificans]|jgi:hypothetical protein|uniref:Uncharacterized protein n=1 Tax=Brevibacillus nitrificans TaxID=651560 RepID=A0A3M8D9W6_9BACL|nr:hypothetical protein [Brevibacillus nitrificans]MED1793071.1 hypothetical protein [Brevibacillus nitrificans]RNB84075.1 hypothetical protein EDM59_16340 [Brevibacillus nitrificans]